VNPVFDQSAASEKQWSQLDEAMTGKALASPENRLELEQSGSLA